MKFFKRRKTRHAKNTSASANATSTSDVKPNTPRNINLEYNNTRHDASYIHDCNAMDDYDIFSTQGFWRPSVFTLGTEPEDSIFEGLHLKEASSLASKHSKGNLFEGLLDDFDLPPLEDALTQADSEQNLSHDLDAKPVSDPNRDPQSEDHDVWDFGAEPPALPTDPVLYTWEAFQLGDNAPSNLIYLSEAGDNAFNTVFQQREQSAGIIQHDVTLKACYSLVLGSSSILFQWDATKSSFTPVLERVALSGLSLLGSHSLIAHFIKTGTIFRKLFNFATQSSSKDCTAMVAFRRCVGDMLDHVERHVCEQLHQIRSLLQLQQVTDRPYHVLEHIDALLERLRRVHTDEVFISMLSDEVTALAESGSVLVGTMREILVLVSMPWLQALAEDVGLASSLRANTQLAAPSDTAHTDQHDLLKAQFLEAEDRRTVASVRRSISLLRQHVPDHPLVRPDVSFLGQDVSQMMSRYDTEALVQRADDFKDQMSDAVLCYCHGSNPVEESSSFDDAMDLEQSVPDDHGPFALSALEDIADLDDETPHDMSSDTHVYARLRKTLEEVLADGCGDATGHLAQTTSDVLAPLRPFIDVQASLVNGAVMRYIFNTYHLRDHLELHRSYHLFGNGDFVTRIATALFSGEVQTAERKRGNIPTSETMGLRLDSRESQRWPPASSELRLTLLNVLSESYAPHSTHEDKVQLPGGLSFAIRELTDAEIDRVMDPTSIYALDFLRLQYTPPSPLADIFTATIAQHYDVVFRTLLVHVRVLHATSQLATLCNKQTQQSSTCLGRQLLVRRFAWKARQLSTTIFSHFTDTVIAGAWNAFSEHLDALQPGEADQVHQSADLHSITRLHETCLDDIRAKMFLRHKHAKIRVVLEELAAIVIKTTLSAVHDTASRSSVAEQEKRFDLLSEELRALLEVLANKPSKEDRGDVIMRHAQSEGDVAKLLLARLSW